MHVFMSLFIQKKGPIQDKINADTLISRQYSTNTEILIGSYDLTAIFIC